MARDLPSGMDSALAASGVRLIYLVEMVLSQGTYRYALAATDISFASTTYTATSGGFSEMAETTDRGAPTFRLTLQNADGTLGTLVDGLGSGADARGKRVTIRTVEETQIADSTAVLTDTFVIAECRVTREAVSFALGSPMATAVETPFRTLGSSRCPWVYKSRECGSVSTEAKCGKTMDDCRARFSLGEALRFGGNPGRTRNRQRLYL